ncbi:MAG: NADP-dependent oxidoreductase [Gallionella sp.]
MKAVRIHAYGDADVLRYEDVPMPGIAANEVLVRVVASSVNPVDWKIREGYLKQIIPCSFPLTLGWDVSGVVEAVGEGISRFKVGDAVFSRPDIKRNGTYAEYVAIREDEIAHKPGTLSHVEAATLPLAGIAAWEAIHHCGEDCDGTAGADSRSFRWRGFHRGAISQVAGGACHRHHLGEKLRTGEIPGGR